MDRQKQINWILENFNFRHCHKAMTALGWEWAGSDSVPSINEMKAEAERLLLKVTGKISCGGFEAELKDEKLSLAFVLEDIDCRDIAL